MSASRDGAPPSRVHGAPRGPCWPEQPRPRTERDRETLSPDPSIRQASISSGTKGPASATCPWAPWWDVSARTQSVVGRESERSFFILIHGPSPSGETSPVCWCPLPPPSPQNKTRGSQQERVAPPTCPSSSVMSGPGLWCSWDEGLAGSSRWGAGPGRSQLGSQGEAGLSGTRGPGQLH